ncbi:MAG: hypothetical protein AABM67_09910 [Acidobacteriota bacterium]
MDFFGDVFDGDKRNSRLAAWGKTVPVSDAQHAAMRKIWQAVQSKCRPEGDPLEHLSSKDLAYILRICGSNYRPAEFGNSDALRLASWRYLKKLGFNETEAAVAIGMMFNFVGRDEI